MLYRYGCLVVLVFVGALLDAYSSEAHAQARLLQCTENERLARIVLRTGHNDNLQFFGAECRRKDGTPRRIKAGIERGRRHEIIIPGHISKILLSKGTCRNGGSVGFSKICSLSFQFSNGTSTPEFGAGLLAGSRRELSGNGEIYGIAAFFRQERSDFESGFTDLKIVTRKLWASGGGSYDTAGVLRDIRQAMNGSMGYAAVIRNTRGQRVGFVRAGWAIHPFDRDLSRHAGQFDVHTKAAVGSTAKVWASAAAALRVDEFTQADTLNTRFGNYLPRRWRGELHARFANATVRDVIRHEAGFRFSGPSSDQAQGILPARFRLRTGDIWQNPNRHCKEDNPNCNRLPSGSAAPYEQRYSNSAGGLFHFILPHMMLASESGAPAMEDRIAGMPDRAYDQAIARFTGTYYEDFVQEHILSPVNAVASCNTRAFLGKQQVAASYSNLSDRTGTLPASSVGHCASGGWVISVNDLSRVLHALKNTNDIIALSSRRQLFDPGPNRLWPWKIQSAHGHNGLHGGMRAAVLVLSDGYTVALAYNSLPNQEDFRDTRMLMDAFVDNVR